MRVDQRDDRQPDQRDRRELRLQREQQRREADDRHRARDHRHRRPRDDALDHLDVVDHPLGDVGRRPPGEVAGRQPLQDADQPLVAGRTRTTRRRRPAAGSSRAARRRSARRGSQGTSATGSGRRSAPGRWRSRALSGRRTAPPGSSGRRPRMLSIRKRKLSGIASENPMPTSEQPSTASPERQYGRAIGSRRRSVGQRPGLGIAGRRLEVPAPVPIGDGQRHRVDRVERVGLAGPGHVEQPLVARQPVPVDQVARERRGRRRRQRRDPPGRLRDQLGERRQRPIVQQLTTVGVGLGVVRGSPGAGRDVPGEPLVPEPGRRLSDPEAVRQQRPRDLGLGRDRRRLVAVRRPDRDLARP